MTDQTSAYGDHAPVPGEPPRGPTASGSPPPPVQNAVIVMFVRAAMGVLGLIVLFVTKDSLREQIQLAEPTLSGQTVDAATSAALTLGAVLGVVFIGLYLLLALQVRQGKGWARTVTVVLAGLGVLSGLASVLQTAPASSRGLSLITLALDIAIIGLLAQRRSNDYFRRPR
jgi:hypothetical protein